MFKFIPEEVPFDLRFDIKSIGEEKANMLSHGIGFLVFAASIPFLLFVAFQSKNLWYLSGSVIFSIALLMVYASSTLYHSAYKVKLRRRLRIFDHISIYFLIAASYTPFILTYFKDKTGYTILIILWTTTLAGIVFKIFYTHRFKIASTLLYLLMGWLAIFMIEPIINTVPSTCLIWLIVGGFFYTTGVIFYLWKGLYLNHFIWHLFTFSGSGAHFIAVVYCLA